MSSIKTISDVRTGDTFLVRGQSFLSRAICHVMRKWARKQGYSDLLISLTMSHAASFVVHKEIPWVPFIYGSTESGYKPLEFEKHYNWDKDEFVVMRRKRVLNDDDVSVFTRFNIHLVTVSLLYQYWNLIQWCLLVYLGLNTFWWDRDPFTYCYESAYKSRQILDPELYPKRKNPDIFQLLSDKNYEIVYLSKALRAKENMDQNE